MWHWLVNQGHLYSALVGWVVGVTMTGIVVGMLVRPLFSHVKEAWKKHEKTQTRIAENLDTSTPGGLSEIKQLLEENIDRGQE